LRWASTTKRPTSTADLRHSGVSYVLTHPQGACRLSPEFARLSAHANLQHPNTHHLRARQDLVV
jgi:hypothetical protein